MSEQATEAGAPEIVILPPQGDAAFGALMDALSPEADGADAAQGQPAAGAPDATGAGAGGTGQAAAPGTGAAPATGAGAGDGAAAGGGPAGDAGTAAPAAGDGAAPGTGADGTPGDGGAEPPAGGGGTLPADWTADAADLVPQLGEISTAYETKVNEEFQRAAFEEVQTEHKQYFEALQKHPRTLVGTKVPAIGKEGFETLRDAADAREWQDAVKALLVEEVRGRAGKSMDESRDAFDVVHASIELFQNNSDLMPGTKGFDVDLANRFAELATPYELRVEGKLQGYSIPVQPIITQLRAQLVAERAKTPAPPVAGGGAAAPAASAGTAVPPTAAAGAAPEQPQAGIQSKAGAGTADEDFSTLFGTIGLPDLRI